jgi:hypothetical protein
MDLDHGLVSSELEGCFVKHAVWRGRLRVDVSQIGGLFCKTCYVEVHYGLVSSKFKGVFTKQYNRPTYKESVEIFKEDI